MSRPGRELSMRIRQSLLTAGLLIPLLVAIASAPPFSAEPRAQGASKMVGPLFPIMAGSEGVVPMRSGNTISYPSSWACGGDTASHTITLSNPDGSGQFQTISRELGSLHQELSITSVVGGAPRQFQLNETRGSALVHSTLASLIDQDSDGIVDAVAFSGQYNVTISLARSGDYVSIPWAEANTIGIDTTYPCGGALPQVWIPLADTNGDGLGDAVVLDLDGNGIKDSDLFAGPMVSAPSVPTMGPGARLVLMVLIGLMASWFLSRRREHTEGTPA